MVVAVVIMAGRTLFEPASRITARSSFNGFRIILLHKLLNVSADKHPIVCGYSEQGNESNPHSNAQIDGVHLEQIPQTNPCHASIQKPGLAV